MAYSRASSVVTATAGSNATLNVSTVPVAGEIVIVCIVHTNNATPATPPSGHGFTQILVDDPPGNPGSQLFEVWAKAGGVSGQTDDDDMTFGINGAGAHCWAVVFDGVDSDDPIQDSGINATDLFTTLTSPSVTATADGECVFIGINFNVGAPSPPSSPTQGTLHVNANNGANDCYFGAASLSKSAGATGTCEWSNSSVFPCGVTVMLTSGGTPAATSLLVNTPTDRRRRSVYARYR